MGWVIKIPKRSDFCGCPPCPLCFVFVDEDKLKRDQEAGIKKLEDKAEVLSGIEKMARDLLGEIPATPEQTKTLEDAAEKIHARNLVAQVEGPRNDGATFEEMDRAKRLEMQVKSGLKEARKLEEAKKRADIKPKPGKTLDDMDFDPPKPVPPRPKTVEELAKEKAEKTLQEIERLKKEAQKEVQREREKVMADRMKGPRDYAYDPYRDRYFSR